MSEGRRDKRPSPSKDLRQDPVEGYGAPTARQLQVNDDYLAKVPKVILASEEVNTSDLDNREYFLLSLLDGTTTIETMLDISGMPAEEALALLDGLVRRGIVGLPE